MANKEIAMQKMEIERQVAFAKQLEDGGDSALSAAMRESQAAREEVSRLQAEMQAKMQSSQEENERLRAELLQFQQSVSASEREESLRQEIEKLRAEIQKLRAEASSAAPPVPQQRTSVEVGVGEHGIETPPRSPLPIPVVESKKPEEPQAPPPAQDDSRARIDSLTKQNKELRARIEVLERENSREMPVQTDPSIEQAARDRALEQERHAEELRRINGISE